MSDSSGNLLPNLIYFGRLLRAIGLDIQPDGVGNLVKSTAWVPIDRKQDFYRAARSVLIRRHQDLSAFDQAFQQFWRVSAGWNPEMESDVENLAPTEHDSTTPEPHGTDTVGIAPQILYSPLEALRHKDFAKLNAEELNAIKPLLAELTWKLGQRHSRRWRRGNGNSIDVRLMLRQSLRYGGEPLQVFRRKHRSKPRRLVVIADISGSMERYSSLLLHFIFGLSQSLDQKSEAFVFSTRLTRITRQMRSYDVDHALGEVSKQVPDWSGGTRIGLALKTFNFFWTRRVLARRAVVLLVSDGWDRGEVGLLRMEMARLQRSCYRLIWLNPQLGSPDYEPRARGMRAALPFVDDFLPILNLSSVEDLAWRLETLEEHRPARKQQPAKLFE